MGKRGPQPKPTPLRELEGKPGKGRPISKFEPRPPRIAAAEPPNWMSDWGRAYWFKLLPMLSRIGLLTEADLPLFERYCDALGEWHQYREFLQTGNRGLGYPIYDPTRKGADGKPMISHVKVHPQSVRKLKLSEALLRMESHFGMTPAARTRIMVGDIDPLSLAPPPSSSTASEDDTDEYDPFKPALA